MAPALPKLLAAWCREYDWIVLDSPPAFVAETAVLAQQADLILLVARPGMVERANLRHAIEALERVDVPRGLVLNAVGRQHTGYYSGSGYYYYHSSYGRDAGGEKSAPGQGLKLKKATLDFDFANQVDEYRIGKNDILNIYVVDHPEMSSQRVNIGEISGTVVQKDGFVYLPVAGKVQAAGFTVVEFAEHLRTTAASYIVAPEVSVEVLRYASQKFYVLGRVAKPGAFPVDGDTTLLEGLGFAGGTLPDGDLEGAYVLRGGQLLPISLADILLRGDVERNVLMRDRDVVFVPDSADKKVYVLGEVAKPSVVPIQRERITLAEALAAAGGPTIAHSRA